MGNVPTEADAAAIATETFGQPPTSVVRFTTGLANYVYDVTAAGYSVVVRIAPAPGPTAFEAAVEWSTLLRALGVPLPDLIRAGTYREHAFLVLQRLPGTDLIREIATLSIDKQRALAAEIVAIGHRVRTLAPGGGFGFVARYRDRFPHPTWRDVLDAGLARSRERLVETRVVDASIVDRFREPLDQLNDYFIAVEPRPFLHDLTTKNVIVHDGRLSGIVDVDDACFGDELFTPALTFASLAADTLPTDYVAFWLQRLQPSGPQRAAFCLYVAYFALDLLSEMGHTFNQPRPVPVNAVRRNRVLALIDEYLSSPASVTSQLGITLT